MSLGRVVLGLAAMLRGARAVKEGLSEGRLSGDATASEGGGMRLKRHTVRTIDQRVHYIKEMIRKSRDLPEIRKFAVQTVSKRCGQDWCIKERDYVGEVTAIHLAIRQRIRYVADTWGRDLFQTADRTLEFGGEDCFPAGTMMLAKGNRLVPVEELREGMEIWGLDRWSRVEAAWSKGILPVDEIRLNNGSTIRLTADHHVFVLDCPKHRRRARLCSCPIAERVERRIKVSELKVGDVLPTPKRIPFGAEMGDPDRAYVEGLFVADGWADRDSCFSISGQDGCPKEAQKREVERICERLGIPTHWMRKSITVKDPAWTAQMRELGTHAPQKHFRTLDVDEAVAANWLRGVMADSGANHSGLGRTFTTTSRELAVQVRLLHKMFGITCGASFIEDHGGLGKNPIWRMSTRGRDDGKHEKLLRVRAISREVLSLPCYDLTTDDHRVYLPEADVTVSQCDGYCIALGAALNHIGYPVVLRVIQTTDAHRRGSDWDHIYLLVGLPPDAPRKWMSLDASTPNPPGWEVPRSRIHRKRDFPVS